MPNRKKYTDEQRKQVKALYAMGRSQRTDDSYSKGRFTLKQIGDRTGVGISMVYAIGNGAR